MGDSSKFNIMIVDKKSGKVLSNEERDYLLSLLEEFGIDIDGILKNRKSSDEQTLVFEDEVIIEVYDKSGRLKDKRVV